MAGVVLLAHGFFQTRNLWEVMEERLRFDGYRVESLAHAGFGVRFGTQPVERLARHLREEVEAATARHGVSGVHLIAHSRAGLAARRCVVDHGGHCRVHSLITLGTAHHARTGAAAAAVLHRAPLRVASSDLVEGLAERLIADVFPPHIPITSIYSREDQVVPWWASVLRPAHPEADVESVEVAGVGHSQLAWDPAVYQEVRRRLDHAVARVGEREEGQ